MKSTLFQSLVMILPAVLLPACGGNNTLSRAAPPGAEKTAKTRMLETGAAVLQSKAPLEAINVYMDGFHAYNGDIRKQAEAHHYCSMVNEDVKQCVIYNGNGKNALLMGVEYIVSEKIFKTLPEDEKKLWHSHAYEVKSGQLIAPGIPEVAEHELMEELASTYGKTWHTWHTEQKTALPLGIPQLMIGFTADGQINPWLTADRDRRFNVSTEAKKQERADIAPPSVQLGADAWRQGEVRQLRLGSGTGKPVSGR